MNKKLLRTISAAGALLTLAGTVASLPASAASYSTYTYSYDGESLPSPDAYTPERVIDSKSIIGLETPLEAPADIEVDKAGNVYIADPTHNRIVVLNKHYQYKFEISEFVNDNSVADKLADPQGITVWESNVADENGKIDKCIYVSDTSNARIVVFNEDGSFRKIYEQPSSAIFESTQIYSPVAAAADSAGRLYVVSKTTYQGIISLTPDGEFSGYIGAQKVSYSVLERLWRRFQTAEQRAKSEVAVSTAYNNIDIDDDGFVYITSNSIDEGDLSNAIQSGDAGYAPVKKLNTAGNDIMKRNGFFIPAGEVNFRSAEAARSETDITGPSSIVDVALGPEGTWSIIDDKRSKVYTYDQNGELLFIFGDQGTQMGNLQKVVGIVYQGNKMLILDSQTASFTVYKTTDYGELLLNAIRNENNLEFGAAENDWLEILKRNNNFDAAYIGLGKSYSRMGQWDKSMYYFQQAYETENYSDSFGESRKLWVEKYIWVIPIVVVGFFALLSLFFKYAKKVNTKAATSGKKRTFKEEVLYCTHLIFHPFDGFWDLKHEKRGSVRGALLILTLAVVCFAYQAIGQAYIFNPYGGYASIFNQLLGLLVPLLLGATANWCLTTLFDGEGSFKDIFVALCYSLSPIILFVPLATLLTHVVTNAEAGFVSLLLGVCYVWVGMLIFFGTMVTHDYSLMKNVVTLLGTILCACVIMFVAVLFSSLMVKMASFVSNLITEVTYNM